MTNEHDFTESKFERRVSRLEEGQHQLIGTLSRVESIVETLASNQKAVTGRINRPWQWGAVVAGFVAIMSMAGVFATVLSLSITPIQAGLTHIEETALVDQASNKQQHHLYESRLNSVEAAAATYAEALRWNEKMGDRNNNQIDLLWFQLKNHQSVQNELHNKPK